MKIGTKCVQAGYQPKNGEAIELPICQSTTFLYESTEHVAKLFDFEAEGHFYSRISNPTIEGLEKKITALEGGVGTLCVSSGQAAVMTAITNIAGAGDHVLSSGTLYGGTMNLLSVVLKRFGIQVTFFDTDLPAAEIQKKIQTNTKMIYAETLANPALKITDIRMLADLAHAGGIPLIIDNTFATPILCRPFEYGADIIVHSTTKYMDGHATSVGGSVTDSGRFDWSGGKFPELTEPDDSYHGMVYTEHFGKAAYIAKARAQLIRDMGNCMSPMNAFLTNLGIETLALRMRKHCDNALKIAQFLEAHEQVQAVNYPGLPSNAYHQLANKYLPDGCSGVVSFEVKGGRERAAAVMDRLRMISIVVHVSDVRSHVLHPATSTHRQLTDGQLIECGISPGMIRLTVGIEEADDIIEDLNESLSFK